MDDYIQINLPNKSEVFHEPYLLERRETANDFLPIRLHQLRRFLQGVAGVESFTALFHWFIDILRTI